MISVIVPCYNEEKTIQPLLEKVFASDTLGLRKQIIVVNDGSSDSSSNILKSFEPKIELIELPINQGKGFAVREGLKRCTGDFVIIQDADLEYSPNDYKIMLECQRIENSQVVYGVRNRNDLKLADKLNIYFCGSFVINQIVNVLWGQRLQDIHTCYKLFKTELIRDLKLGSDGFEICHEITCKILNKDIKISEVPVSYRPRNLREGKKIRPIDGLLALAKVLEVRYINKGINR